MADSVIEDVKSFDKTNKPKKFHHIPFTIIMAMRWTKKRRL